MMEVWRDLSAAELKERFPKGWVKCAECGAYYDSLEVYKATQSPPDYEWRGACGHPRLKRRQAPDQEGYKWGF